MRAMRAASRVSAIRFAFFLLLFACRVHAASETPRPDRYSGEYGDLTDIYLDNNSDWWSEIPKGLGGEPPGELLIRRPEPQNFQILEISVWGYSLNWPQKIVRTLGRAAVIERGDASVGRSQVCYKSVGGSGNTKLIFETGECSESFYLFEDGAPFVGSDRCVASMQVSERLKTPSGLGLGLTPTEVIKLLGQPSTTRPDNFVYIYRVNMRLTKEQIESERREAPDLAPDLEYDSDLSLVIKFRKGRSWYLYVTSARC
jgi:hypothetical protein